MAGYNVYRDGVKVNTAPVGSVSYSDTGLAPGANHTYTVSAIDAAGNESGQSGSWSGAAGSGALTTSYTYDAENRLTQLQTGSSVIGSYAYDGAGNRYQKTAGGVTTNYTLDLASTLPQVLTETAGSAVTSYAYGGGPLELDQSGTSYWYLPDTLGSVRLVTDSTGATPATYAYSAFGSTRKSSGSLANEVRFTGERTDGESGLEFLRARTYDPSVGTFLQRDSWGITATDSQSLDGYVYTADNPVNAVDPSGHQHIVYDDGTGGNGILVASTSAYTAPSEWSGYDKDGGSITTSGPGAYTAPVNAQTQGRPPTPTFTKPSSTPPQPCDNIVCSVTNKVGDLGGGAGNAYSQTIGNNFMNPAADTLGSWGIKYDATLGFCVGGDGSYGLPIGWGGQLVGSFCAYAGTNGQLAYGVTYGLGGGPGTKGGHAGLDIGPLFTNASGDPYDQEGPFVNSNGEISEGWAGFFVSGTGGKKRCGGGLMYNVSGGWAPGVGASMSSGVTGTKTDIWWSSHDAPPPC